jgi:hypothetical protein
MHHRLVARRQCEFGMAQHGTMHCRSVCAMYVCPLVADLTAWMGSKSSREKTSDSPIMVVPCREHAETARLGGARKGHHSYCYILQSNWMIRVSPAARRKVSVLVRLGRATDTKIAVRPCLFLWITGSSAV